MGFNLQIVGICPSTRISARVTTTTYHANGRHCQHLNSHPLTLLAAIDWIIATLHNAQDLWFGLKHRFQ